jgi:hypothetical protein
MSMPKSTASRKPKPLNPARHGFYSELFSEQELALLNRPLALEDEEKLLRVRVLMLARRLTKDMDLKDELGGVGALARMIQMIATLERVRLLVHGSDDEANTAILRALSELDPYEEL